MKTDSFIIIGAAILGLGLIYHVAKKPATGAPAASVQGGGSVISSQSPYTVLGNVFGTAGTASLGSGAAKVFGTDPYGVFGASTIGMTNDGTQLSTSGIMGAFQ